MVLAKFAQRLQKTRERLGQRLGEVLGRHRSLDDEFVEDLEEVLLEADLGPTTVMEILDRLQESAVAGQVKDPGQAVEWVRDSLVEFFTEVPETELAPGPTVVLLVGVNGVGKTTTLAKLAYRLQQQGRRPMLVAADTFRAAAIEQLQVWANRLGIPAIAHGAGGDPGAVVYDALQAMGPRQRDVVLVDTAGRLHTKHNLMEELKKVRRIADREKQNAELRSLLVLDATTGQNALNQARMFHQSLELDGLVLTKLDGTARGGIALAVSRELQLPVWFVGLGEAMEDLEPFKPRAFVEALFSEKSGSEA